MGFKNDDTITAINVEPGDHVTAGQVLAQQDTATLRSALQQAERSVEQDEINIKTAALTYNTNLKTLERQKKLYESGAVSQSDLDNAQDNLAKSELELQVAQSKLKNDQVKVEEARSDLEGATLVAPFDGIIGEVNGQVGQINGINASSATLLTIMSEELQLSALVNEADIGRIKVGQDVEFTSSTFADKTFTGQVLRITPQATTVSNVQYYPC
jgi:HlyD family secretion protein